MTSRKLLASQDLLGYGLEFELEGVKSINTEDNILIEKTKMLRLGPDNEEKVTPRFTEILPAGLEGTDIIEWNPCSLPNETEDRDNDIYDMEHWLLRIQLGELVALQLQLRALNSLGVEELTLDHYHEIQLKLEELAEAFNSSPEMYEELREFMKNGRGQLMEKSEAMKELNRETVTELIKTSQDVVHEKLVELQIDPSNGNLADLESEVELLIQSKCNHLTDRFNNVVTLMP